MDVQPKRPPPPQLTPWKPGQSGNPGGRPKLNMSGKEMAALICKQFRTSKREILAILENSELTSAEHMVARQIEKVMEKGDVATFATLCDRAFGKLKEGTMEPRGKVETALEIDEKIEPASIADYLRSIVKAAA